MTQERDREATEKRLLDTVGTMIAEQGFEKLGINAVANQAGVSKILIYRYFGSLDGLLAAYIKKHDFWINFSMEIPAREEIPSFFKKMFHDQIDWLRSHPTLRRLYRWELSTNNELIVKLREQREKFGVDHIAKVCEVTGYSRKEMEVLASVMTASITYLVMLEEFCPFYNGIEIRKDSGWEQIKDGVDKLIDKVFG